MQRREIEEGDICPICYEEFSGANPAQLVHCRSGCGQNVHGKCMRVCVQHSVTTQQVRLLGACSACISALRVWSSKCAAALMPITVRTTIGEEENPWQQF